MKPERIAGEGSEYGNAVRSELVAQRSPQRRAMAQARSARVCRSL
jgi:hypothetical protein